MSEQQIATAAELFGRPSVRRFKTLPPLPVCCAVVRIQSLTEREKSEWESATIAKKGDGLRLDRLKDANRRLFQLCMVDADGNRFVTDAQREEIANWDSADTATLYDECSRHCGIRQGEIEDIVKNSGATTASS